MDTKPVLVLGRTMDRWTTGEQEPTHFGGLTMNETISRLMDANLLEVLDR